MGAEILTERVKIRGLCRLAAVIFLVWGAATAAKGIHDLAGGEPEANLYAPRPWAFVTEEQWRRYAAFELVYGLTCIGLGWGCLRASRFLPETVTRPRRPPELKLFD